jgi:MFS transporter, DHA2 family, methylenomycin A resistance protein
VLLASERNTSYCALFAPLLAMGSGLGMLVPLTSTLLGSVEKVRSASRRASSTPRGKRAVLGVALFGSLSGQTNAFLLGARFALIISAVAGRRGERRRRLAVA